MKLPFILSGPILRRVEPQSVYIWIATSKPCSLKVCLYMIKTHQGEVERYKRIMVKTNIESIKVGKNLYIHLLQLTPSAKKFFPTNILLGYNLHFYTDTEINDLHSLNLLSPENPERITYGNLLLPSFFINESRQSNILYGSCRKPHGDGNDSLAKGDQILDQHYLELNERPSALFLTGDQIYADDIADPLLPMLTTIGAELMGEEFLDDLSDIEPLLEKEPYRAELDKIQGRQKICEELCKFTSKHAGNHLLRFCEFMAMYVMNWNPDLWEHFSDPILTKESSDSASLTNPLSKQQESLKNFHQDSRQVRRLLANIPTYMIFDDHDITDDWNLSESWRNRVWEAPLGRHVISNGLAAYWLFQGWGNDPVSFDEEFKNSMISYYRSFQPHTEDYYLWLNALWNYSDWHFVAPTYPKALFIDTRTQRGYDKGKEQGPRLLNAAAYEKINTLVKHQEHSQPFLLVSPVPVLGIHFIDTFLKNYVYPLRSKGIPVHQILDLESWIFNNQGYGGLIHWLLKQPSDQVVILSGDTHLGFSLHGTIEQAGEKTVSIKQFTSSPLKNKSFPNWLVTTTVTLLEANPLLLDPKSTERFVDHSYNIHEHANLQDAILWKESIQHFDVDNGSFIKTDNNLGLLKITEHGVKNKLIKQRLLSL
jgi:hypothetical protein